MISTSIWVELPITAFVPPLNSEIACGVARFTRVARLPNVKVCPRTTMMEPSAVYEALWKLSTGFTTADVTVDVSGILAGEMGDP
jgi:hypothetical protein